MQMRAEAMRRFVVFVVLLAACTHKTPEEKLLDRVDSSISWIATLQFAGEEWLANSVPTSFIRASVKAAKKDMQNATAAIERSPARRELRDALRAQLDAANSAAVRMKDAVEKNDRRSVAALIRRFKTAHAALDQLQQSEERH
jgi:hypothetical protein